MMHLEMIREFRDSGDEMNVIGTMPGIDVSCKYSTLNGRSTGTRMPRCQPPACRPSRPVAFAAWDRL